MRTRTFRYRLEIGDLERHDEVTIGLEGSLTALVEGDGLWTISDGRWFGRGANRIAAVMDFLRKRLAL